MGDRPQAAAPGGGSGAAIRLPDQLLPRVRDLLEGRKPSVAARDAATVVLMRPMARRGDPTEAPGPAATGGFEVYLLRRRRSMAFAPGAHVFPGGSVDPRDAEAELAWAGPGPEAWGRILAGGSRATGGFGVSHGPHGVPAGQQSGSPALARALICAAVRETFEESGVLLAGPAAGAVPADTRGEDWESDRRALLDGSLSLAVLLQRRNLVLRSGLLKPWARWVTPDLERRRFDTRFFIATLPPGQRTRDVGGEADEVVWLTPHAAIAAARRGEMSLMPPTAVTLAELARHASTTEALAASADMTPRQPVISLTDGAAWLTMPAGTEYPL